MKLLAIGLLTASLTVAPVTVTLAPPLPWQTFSQMSQDIEGMGEGACPDGPVKIVGLNHDGDWRYFTANGRSLVVKFDTDGRPTDVWVVKADGDKLVVVSHQALDEAAIEAGPCPILYPQQS